jgi:hypothetical protein
MPLEAAQGLAERAHAGSLDRYGLPLVDHVRRVAAGVPAEARAIAWLHEVLEYAAVSEDELRAAGASEAEVGAIGLLSRDHDGDDAAYLAHIEQIARAPGDAGRLARIVKHVDLVDRATHRATDPQAPAAPPHLKALDVLSRTALPTV